MRALCFLSSIAVFICVTTDRWDFGQIFALYFWVFRFKPRPAAIGAMACCWCVSLFFKKKKFSKKVLTHPVSQVFRPKVLFFLFKTDHFFLQERVGSYHLSLFKASGAPWNPMDAFSRLKVFNKNHVFGEQEVYYLTASGFFPKEILSLAVSFAINQSVFGFFHSVLQRMFFCFIMKNKVLNNCNDRDQFHLFDFFKNKFSYWGHPCLTVNANLQYKVWTIT